MTVVVSDASPINYLLAIDCIALLPHLFDRVIVPKTVAAELQATGAPPKNLSWIAHMPGWAEIRAASHIDTSLGLDAGESEAIVLAKEVGAFSILMDEEKGREIATQHGLRVIGTIGILERAAELDLIQLATAYDRLRETSFHASPQLLKASLERDRARRDSISSD
jgi:predicted nucleic acid-binding protein